jgi:hypothetical protein
MIMFILVVIPCILIPLSMGAVWQQAVTKKNEATTTPGQ